MLGNFQHPPGSGRLRSFIASKSRTFSKGPAAYAPDGNTAPNSTGNEPRKAMAPPPASDADNRSLHAYSYRGDMTCIEESPSGVNR
jgi:hypothetical protein